MTEDGTTLVNGEPFEIDGPVPDNYGGEGMTWPVVPEGKLLVLGDNRASSCDSHQWRPDPFLPEDNDRAGRDHVLAALPPGLPQLGRRRGPPQRGDLCARGLHRLPHVGGCAPTTLNMVWNCARTPGIAFRR